MFSDIVSFFILRTKMRIAYWLSDKQSLSLQKCHCKRIFFFLAADYGNLGDVAISFAQSKFLSEKYPDAEIVEIPISSTFSGIKAVKRMVGKDDIISIVGGGNIGDMYNDIEFLRQMVVKSFRKNRIISFPQTCDFSGTLSGKIALHIAKCTYSSHPRLTFMVRERTSYELMQKYFRKNDVKLVPDIVMTLDERQIGFERKGTLLCLRNDSERKYDIKDKIVSHLQANGTLFNYYDTHIGRGNLSKEEREQELFSIWTAFAHSDIVITDRLHGMIFAFITGTPAIVIPNANHKIISSYEWIKDCGYIKLLSHPDEWVKEMDYLFMHATDHFTEVHKQIMSAYKVL